MNRRAPLIVAIVALLTCLNAHCGSARAAADAPRAPGPTPARGVRPVPAIERALIISCDGLRPDVLLRADAPHIRKLVDSGSFSFWARTTDVAVTLPSHASMLTGVTPERHGVTWNGDVPDTASARPKVPTLFEVAMRYGMTTAMVAGKSKFDALARVGHVGRSWIRGAKDDEVGVAAVQMLRDYRPDVFFVHFPGADSAGHKHGWGTPEQLAAIHEVDANVGKVLAALDELGLRGRTVVLLSADHGGAGRSHGGPDPRSQHIPWIVSGPGIRQGHDLDRDDRVQVRTEDTFATLCLLLGLEPDGPLDGKPVRQILAERQLLEEAP